MDYTSCVSVSLFSVTDTSTQLHCTRPKQHTPFHTYKAQTPISNPLHNRLVGCKIVVFFKRLQLLYPPTSLPPSLSLLLIHCFLLPFPSLLLPFSPPPLPSFSPPPSSLLPPPPSSLLPLLSPSLLFLPPSPRAMWINMCFC